MQNAKRNSKEAPSRKRTSGTITAKPVVHQTMPLRSPNAAPGTWTYDNFGPESYIDAHGVPCRPWHLF